MPAIPLVIILDITKGIVLYQFKTSLFHDTIYYLLTQILFLNIRGLNYEFCFKRYKGR